MSTLIEIIESLEITHCFLYNKRHIVASIKRGNRDINIDIAFSIPFDKDNYILTGNTIKSLINSKYGCIDKNIKYHYLINTIHTISIPADLYGLKFASILYNQYAYATLKDDIEFIFNDNFTLIVDKYKFNCYNYIDTDIVSERR